MQPFYIDRDPSRVCAWSTGRLSAEPEAWKLDFRDALRSGLDLLRQHACVEATLVTLDDTRVDLGSVLVSSVGPGHLRYAADNGLRFELRREKPPPCPVELDGDIVDYMAYSVVPKHFAPEPEPAAMLDFDLAKLSSSSKPHEVWVAAKRGKTTVRGAIPGDFGIDIALSAPRGRSVSIPSVTKSLLDGVVSALHVHNGELEDALPRLARLTKLGDRQLRTWLSDAHHSVLGPRPLVRSSGRSGIQWNPADDRCVHGTVRLTRSSSPRWRCRVTVHPR